MLTLRNVTTRLARLSKHVLSGTCLGTCEVPKMALWDEFHPVTPRTQDCLSSQSPAGGGGLSGLGLAVRSR